MTRLFLAAAALGLFAVGTASAQFPARFPQPYPRPFPTAPQFPPHGGHHDHHDHHYHVKYRTCNHEPWRTYGTFESHGFAHRVADRLERQGYEARVVHH